MEKVLRKRDKVISSPDSGFCIRNDGKPAERACFSPSSIVELGGSKVGKLESLVVVLHFGDAVSSLEALQTPSGLIESPSGGEYTVSVARSEKEFSQRAAGKPRSVPSLKDIPRLPDIPAFFTQVGCLQATVRVYPVRSPWLQLRAGEITKIQGLIGDFTPRQAGRGQIQALAKTLGIQGI